MNSQGFTRAAPRPLSIYLGAAMAMLPPDATEDRKTELAASVSRMLEGIKKYQAHPFQRTDPGRDLIWREGTSFITAISNGGGKAILLVPSMINGAEILDLLPEQSFARWLEGQGYDVYLFDWGTPSDDEEMRTLDDVVERLNRAAAFVAAKVAGPVDAIGYCMGGTLLLGAAARQPEAYKKIAVLSAPWGFHAGDPRMRMQVFTGTASALQLLETKQVLPVDWIQTVFAHVNPRLALDKFSKFLDMAPDSHEEKIFIAVEDWLNSGQDLPSGVARSCIMDWYNENYPGRGKWVDLKALGSRPVLIVAAAKDILVPPESAIAAVQDIRNAIIQCPPCGHISLMAGRQAEKMVWTPIAEWLNKS